jgi:hypothetical protein
VRGGVPVLPRSQRLRRRRSPRLDLRRTRATPQQWNRLKRIPTAPDASPPQAPPCYTERRPVATGLATASGIHDRLATSSSQHELRGSEHACMLCASCRATAARLPYACERVTRVGSSCTAPRTHGWCACSPQPLTCARGRGWSQSA